MRGSDASVGEEEKEKGRRHHRDKKEERTESVWEEKRVEARRKIPTKNREKTNHLERDQLWGARNEKTGVKNQGKGNNKPRNKHRKGENNPPV